MNALTTLSKKNSLTIVGVNSGTSADGLDFAAMRFEIRDGVWRWKFLHGAKDSLPVRWRTELLRLAQQDAISLADFVRIDEALGKYIGKRVVRFIAQCAVKKIRVHAIASHGQTVRHLPRHTMKCGERINGTLQIGSPERIAALSGCVTVSHFRQADTAVGGEGAPITTPAVEFLLGERTKHRVTLNIGGIANIFVLPPNSRRVAAGWGFDCGPGNALSDVGMEILFQKSYDKNGETAQRGRVSAQLLHAISRRTFFPGGGVHSTGREQYSRDRVTEIVAMGSALDLNKYDIMATMMELTAQKIAAGLRRVAKRVKIDTVYASGGGVHNQYLMTRIESRIAPLRLRTVSELGVSEEYLEAMSYAVLGSFTLRGASAPTTGKIQGVRPILGRICQPPVAQNRKR